MNLWAGEACQQIDPFDRIARGQFGNRKRVGITRDEDVKAGVGDVVALVTAGPTGFAAEDVSGQIPLFELVKIGPDCLFVSLHDARDLRDRKQREPHQSAQDL